MFSSKWPSWSTTSYKMFLDLRFIKLYVQLRLFSHRKCLILQSWKGFEFIARSRWTPINNQIACRADKGVVLERETTARDSSKWKMVYLQVLTGRWKITWLSLRIEIVLALTLTLTTTLAMFLCFIDHVIVVLCSDTHVIVLLQPW